MTVNANKEKLSAEYGELGYCVVRSDDTAFKELVEVAFREATRLVIEHEDHRIKWRHSTGVPKLLFDVHRKSAVFDQLLRSQFVCDAIEVVFNKTPVYISHSKISYKNFGTEQIWLPHQDGSYKRSKIVKGATVAIHLESCDASNGSLEVFPGSFLLGPKDHEIVFVSGEKEPQVRIKERPDGNSVSVSCGQGDIALFDFNTVHQSGTNSRGGHRAIFIFEVQPIIGRPMETDGRPAITLNWDQTNKNKVMSVAVARTKLWFREYFLFPIAKRILFFVHQKFGMFK